jgi:hypothetical protein
MDNDKGQQQAEDLVDHFDREVFSTHKTYHLIQMSVGKGTVLSTLISSLDL